MAAIYIRKAVNDDLDKTCAIISQAKQLLKADGSPQWQDGHPNSRMIQDDISSHVMWVLIVDGQIVGNAALILSPEPTYARIEGGEWVDTSNDYYTIRRIALSSQFRGRRLTDFFMSDLISMGIRAGVFNFRLDTHQLNKRAQHIAKKNGFVRRGIIHVQDAIDGRR
ncbi:acetyltransferase, GNAT family [Lentilactobacillus parafarraginis F0439]|uniref:Acetyltransferase, GNAT family n=1 Tax=Lentilactobacillus parafarraginis F0439 TaxID=797515 RepID=G9ZNR1_9LACO|nr:GNAT family N-acetyltransferase [Lentilactobacillus parafarraginis]EHL98809.1 acetyltransferase, GNAT family [Lentilactobacillus parafarraginis F0439]